MSKKIICDQCGCQEEYNPNEYVSVDERTWLQVPIRMSRPQGDFDVIFTENKDFCGEQCLKDYLNNMMILPKPSTKKG
jgi:hypothetical protein